MGNYGLLMLVAMDDCTKASRQRAKNFIACACWQRFPHATRTAQNHRTGGAAALL